MPTPSNTRKPVGRPRKQPAATSFQAPLIANTEPERPTDHDGVPIMREQTFSNLPNAAPFRISKLILANDEIAFACRDCMFTADSRGDVMEHRNEVHGTRYGKKTPKMTFPKDREIGDPVLPPRPDGKPAPQQLREMTMGEYLAIAPSLKALGDLIDRVETERDEALAEVEKNRIDRLTQHKLDVYASNQETIVELRMQLQRWANYEDIREELYALRAWKKKITQKLHLVGFKLEED